MKSVIASFRKFLGITTSSRDGKILVSHFGEFSQDLVNSLTTNIEQLMIDSGDKKTTVKRMFNILVEGLQNVRIHGERDSDGNQVSFLIVLQNEDNYRFTFGNLVKSSDVEKLTNRIDDLNELDQTEIKSIYMDTLSNGVMSNKGGAGLGFIMIALKSNNKIKYEVLPLTDNLTFFTQSILINRT